MKGKLSRQRAYQLRQRAKGLCVLCPEPAWRAGADRCIKHRDAFNEWRRKHRGKLTNDPEVGKLAS